MKIAFLTEMGFHGKVPLYHPNARTEFSWMIALDADHYNISEYLNVGGYDWVMIIFPKGHVSLNSVGIRLDDKENGYSELYKQNLVENLKENNKNVASIQEGPSWFVNDFSLTDQFNFYNQLSECDVIFAHNEYDTFWYKGWFPNKIISTIPTLLIEELIRDITPIREDKAIIGGAFCRWYGGFQSYLTATEFECPIITTTSHCTQPGEEQVPNLTLLPRMIWIDWMKCLSTFKYAVNLMPTVAAGTFSLNCAYFGIPCIGNKRVDTQRICFPDLSVNAEDVITARNLAKQLKDDNVFYKNVSEQAVENYKKYYTIDKWKEKMYSVLKYG